MTRQDLYSDILIELHVPDFAAVKEFYGTIGYNVVWEKQPKEKQGYLVMRSKNSILNFFCGNEDVYEQNYFKKFTKTTTRGYGVEIIIPIDGIKEFYKKFLTHYPENVVEKLERRYSHEDFRAVDPFGYYLRFVERYNWVEGRDKNGKILEAES